MNWQEDDHGWYATKDEMLVSIEDGWLEIWCGCCNNMIYSNNLSHLSLQEIMDEAEEITEEI